MSLEEEIAIIQFGQDVHSDDEVLNRFAHLDRSEKECRLWDFSFFLHGFKPVDADIEPAISASSLEETDAPCVILRKRRLQNGFSPLMNLAENEREKAYTLMLYLFKTAYQRQYGSEKGNPANWWYWDLSKNGAVEDLLTTHQALVEEVYNDPGFRSEFASIAKLQHADKQLAESRLQETAPEPQTHFTFLSYDEMVTYLIRQDEEHRKYSRPASLLSTSLSKALSIRYGLAAPHVRRVLWEVVERHIKETYQTGLFDD